MKPPYHITPLILGQVASISEKIGEVKSANLQKAPTELRKKNRIRTIHSSLFIEGNTLSLEQITAILNGQRVIAPQKDITEVSNAIAAYDRIASFNPYSLNSFCSAHAILMKNIVPDAGKLRNRSVGIIKGKDVAHIAPPHDLLQPLMKDLFSYLKNDRDLMLIKSCVFHYEMEFIHPFSDGNGRMGRLWQTVLLMQYNPVFGFLPIETLIRKKQKEYYNALEKSDKAGNSTLFIEFMLDIIGESLEELLKGQNISITPSGRMELFRDIVKEKEFTRSDYLRHYKDISAPTASRDLALAVKNGVIRKSGDKRLTRYRFDSV